MNFKNTSFLSALAAAISLLPSSADAATTGPGYVGCYADNNDSVFQYHTRKAGQSISAAKCIEACKIKGYTYAGMQGGKECMCGEEYETVGPATGCSSSCTDGYECGGSNKNSVYRVADFNLPPMPANYRGCWDDYWDRAMGDWIQQGGVINLDKCMSDCAALGKRYAGLQVSNECFCADEYDKHGPGATCRMTCGQGEECGGPWGVSVYEVVLRDGRANAGAATCLATGWGDPHIVSFDGIKYDAHALGLVTMVKSKSTDFTIQAKTEVVKGKSVKPAVTTGVVIKPEGELPLVQVSLAESASSTNAREIGNCDVQLFVDGTPLDIFGGTQISDATVSVYGKLIRVEYPSQNLRLDMEVVIWSNTCHFSIDYIFMDCTGRGDDIIGILGSPNGDPSDEWMDPLGVPIPIPPGSDSFFFEPAYEYVVDNWCIKDPTLSYFTYENPDEQFDYFNHCGDPYDDTLEKVIKAAEENPDDPNNAICDGNILCMTEGIALGTEAANAALTDPATVYSPPPPPYVPPPPYTPPGAPPAGSNGDPHFRTWKNEHFEYHGQCDLVLAKDDDFADGLGFEVQIRTKLVRFWSYIKSAAIRIGEDILEVEGAAEPEKDVAKYWMNLQPQGELSTLGGFPVSLTISDSLKRKFEIDLSSKYPGQKIVVTTYKEFVKVDFVNASEKSFGNAVGILGDFKSGKTYARDAVTELHDFTLLGNEWQVLPFEHMLFHSVEQPQFPKKCLEPEDPQGDRRRRLEESSVSLEQAEAACATLADELDRKDCVYDILATQDLDMVGAF